MNAAAQFTTPTTVEIGMIVACSWGYEQTNVDFYEVVKFTASTATFQKVRSEKTATGDMTGVAVPVPGEFVQESQIRRKIQNLSGAPIFKINDSSYGRPAPFKLNEDGTKEYQPQRFSSYA